MKEEPLISSSLECSKLVMDAMSFLMLKDNPSALNRPDNYEIAPAVVEAKPRVPAGVEQVIEYNITHYQIFSGGHTFSFQLCRRIYESFLFCYWCNRS